MPKRTRQRRVGGGYDPVGQYPKRTGTYSWVRSPVAGDPYPDGIVCAGRLETGQLAYVGRTDIGDQTPAGFFLKESNVIHVPYGCQEHQRSDFDMLVVEDQDILKWERCSHGQRPNDSALVPVDVGGNFSEKMQVGRTCTPLTDGNTYDGHRLELTRFAHSENVCRPGKIHRSHGCLYVPYSGREYIFNHHEMLMLKISPGSLKDICRWVIRSRLNRLGKCSEEAFDELRLPKAITKFLK